MGRFVNVSQSNTDTGYKNAVVFDTPGTTTWTVPAGVNQAKVFVIGAGSRYRETCFFFCSSNCCSGVTTPATNYCMRFKGILPGAGGGYAEKTVTDISPGTSASITVGSETGASASVFSLGATTITANNATETTVTWTCLSNSTARNNANDNATSVGFQLPRCGYANCISGYFNAGGTATGGDVNRTGGSGVFIPWFCENSYYDGAGAVAGASTPYSCTNSSSYSTGYDYSFGGTRYNCVCTVICACPGSCPNANCGTSFTSSYTNHGCNCLISYHNVFGGQCYYNMPWASCICQRFCSACLCISGGTASNRHYWAGSGVRASGDYGAADGFTFGSCPVGIGAEAGSSSGDGYDAISEQVVSPVSGAGGSGGGGATSTYVCYIGFSQDHFTFVFGSGISNWPCACITHLAGASGTCTCYNLGFVRDESLYKKSNTSIIPLSTLQAESGNLTDFRFGYGATLDPAGYGGGGNRLNPDPGNGAVVIVY